MKSNPKTIQKENSNRRIINSFTDLSVLDRSTKNLSSKTKKYLEDYNKIMKKKRSSKLYMPKKNIEQKTLSESEDSQEVSLKIDKKSEISVSIKEKNDLLDVETNNKFNISKE